MKLNGCHNRAPFQDTVVVQAGWVTRVSNPPFGTPTRDPVMVTLPNANTKDCQYSKTTTDPRCAGCKWNQQETTVRRAEQQIVETVLGVKAFERRNRE